MTKTRKIIAPVRQQLVDLMQATIADEAARHDWTYAAVRPLPTPAKPWRPGMKVRGDCSRGVQWLCWWTGAPNPMGGPYTEYGNSQTIWSNLQHVDTAADLEPGDIITFGAWGSAHATMVLAAGADPLLWSFGHQGAPESYRLSQDGRPHQLCKLPVVFVPTPDDRLRAMTGWFAWVAWRLGEGDWRHKAPRDPRVRPHVPTLIPAVWWFRFAQFLANRKGAN